MSLLDQLRGLFARDEIPDEAKRIFDKAQTPHELLKGLDKLLTENEVEFKELERELERLEDREKSEMQRVREGAVDGRQKRNTLLQIQRLRKQMDNYESRLRIYDRNMNLHLNLIGKIQEMEAMKLRGVDESKIDRIVMDFEETLEKYNDTMNAAEIAQTTKSTASARDERELAALEREIVGGEAAAPVREKEPRKPIDEVLAERPRAAEEKPAEKKQLELE